MSWWPKIASLRRICGDEDARWLADHATQSIATLGGFLDGHHVDAEFVQAGWLWTATTRAHVGAWNGVLDVADRLGRDMIFQHLAPNEVVRRAGSPVHIAGILEPMNGTVHPAKLGQGLARIARKLGVQIYAETRVERIERTRPAKLLTERGTVPAERVVIATNAWAAAAGLPEPIRYLGGSVVRGAMVRKDMAELAERPPSLIDRGLALLGPAGLEDK